MVQMLLWAVFGMAMIGVLWCCLKAGTAPRAPLNDYDGTQAWHYDSH